MKSKAQSSAPKITEESEYSDDLLRSDTPEARLLCAVLGKALTDYWCLWKISQSRPLRPKQRNNFVMLQHWLFSTDDDPDYLNLNRIATLISDYPETLVERLRSMARNRPDSLRLWVPGRVRKFTQF